MSVLAQIEKAEKETALNRLKKYGSISLYYRGQTLESNDVDYVVAGELKDRKLLARLARKDSNPEVRDIAVRKLIMNLDNLRQGIPVTQLSRGEKALLTRMVLQEPSSEIQHYIIENYPKMRQDVLETIACDQLRHFDVRCAAIEQLTKTKPLRDIEKEVNRRDTKQHAEWIKYRAHKRLELLGALRKK